MAEAVEAGAGTGAGTPLATPSDDELPPYQRRGPPEVVLAGPDSNRELVRDQQTNMMRQYAPATLTYTSASASSTATIDYTTSGPGSGAVPVPVQLDPFQDTLTTQAPAITSSSSLRQEGGEFVGPDSATSGQTSTRDSHSEIDEEREMLRIQVMMLQRQLDEIQGTYAADTTSDLPPAYD
jgi:hypothetical protein